MSRNIGNQKQNSANIKLKRINQQESLPTEEIEQKRESHKQFQKINRSKVPTEKSSFDLLLDGLKKFGELLTAITAIISITAWCTYLKFSIDDASKTIEKHESLIEKNNLKLEKLELSDVAKSKDIESINYKTNELINETKSINEKIESSIRNHRK